MSRHSMWALLVLIPVLAQAQRKREFQLRGGFGLAVYGTTTQIRLTAFEPDLTFMDDDGAATLHAPIELRYEISERVNVGLDFKLGSYIYDPDSAEGKSNHFFTVGAAVEYNFVTKDNFRWYGGAGFNAGFLELQESYVLSGVPLLETDRYSGPGFRLNSGVLIYLSGVIGLHFNLGYDSHHFTLRELEINGQLQDLDFFKATLDTKGADLTLGLVVRL